MNDGNRNVEDPWATKAYFDEPRLSELAVHSIAAAILSRQSFIERSQRQRSVKAFMDRALTAQATFDHERQLAPEPDTTLKLYHHGLVVAGDVAAETFHYRRSLLMPREFTVLDDEITQHLAHYMRMPKSYHSHPAAPAA